MMKIKNKPLIPDLNIPDYSKELNNTETFQKLRDGMDEKEKEIQRQEKFKEIRYWVLTIAIAILSFLAGKLL